MASRGFVRYTTLAFNLIVFLMSLVLLAIGIWILVDSNSLVSLLMPENSGIDPTNANLVKNAGIAVTVVASVTMVTSFLGCFGAWKDNRCLLIMFFIILSVIFAAVMMVAITALVRQDLVRTSVEEVLNYNVRDPDSSQNSLYMIAHDKYDCCGVAADTSCHQIFPGNGCEIGSDKCQNGCLDAVWGGMIMPYLNGIAAVLFLLAVVILGGMFFSMCLVCTRSASASS